MSGSFCPSCGAAHQQDGSFCERCGAPRSPAIGPRPIGPHANPPTNPAAVVSIAAGIASMLCGPVLGIIGLVAGYRARREIRAAEGAQRGAGLAIAGITTSLVGFVVFGLAVVAIAIPNLVGRADSNAGPVVPVSSEITTPTTSPPSAPTTGRDPTTTAAASVAPPPTNAPGAVCFPDKPLEPPFGGKPTVGSHTPTKQLLVTDLEIGAGLTVGPTDTVTIAYVGVVAATGVQFDASWDQGQPATFPLPQVIEGFQQGVSGMAVGGRRLIVIPSGLAYGNDPPAGSGIPPGADLAFIIDVLQVCTG